MASAAAAGAAGLQPPPELQEFECIGIPIYVQLDAPQGVVPCRLDLRLGWLEHPSTRRRPDLVRLLDLAGFLLRRFPSPGLRAASELLHRGLLCDFRSALASAAGAEGPNPLDLQPPEAGLLVQVRSSLRCVAGDPGDAVLACVSLASGLGLGSVGPDLEFEHHGWGDVLVIHERIQHAAADSSSSSGSPSMPASPDPPGREQEAGAGPQPDCEDCEEPEDCEDCGYGCHPRHWSRPQKSSPGSAGLYRLDIRPRHGIPLHIHQRMLESELSLDHGVLIQGCPNYPSQPPAVPRDPAEASSPRDPALAGPEHAWRCHPHFYFNPSFVRPARILCINAPRFTPGDELVVPGEQAGLQRLLPGVELACRTASSQEVWAGQGFPCQPPPPSQGREAQVGWIADVLRSSAAAGADTGPAGPGSCDQSLGRQHAWLGFPGGLGEGQRVWVSLGAVEHAPVPSPPPPRLSSPPPAPPSVSAAGSPSLGASVAVLVIQASSGRLLLARHRIRGWEIPGGKVEPGETPVEAALRELGEETGLTADALAAPLRPLAQYAFSTSAPGCPGELKTVFLATLRQDEAGSANSVQVCPAPGVGVLGEPAGGDEVSQVALVPLPLVFQGALDEVRGVAHQPGIDGSLPSASPEGSEELTGDAWFPLRVAPADPLEHRYGHWHPECPCVRVEASLPATPEREQQQEQRGRPQTPRMELRIDQPELCVCRSSKPRPDLWNPEGSQQQQACPERLLCDSPSPPAGLSLDRQLSLVLTERLLRGPSAARHARQHDEAASAAPDDDGWPRLSCFMQDNVLDVVLRLCLQRHGNLLQPCGPS